MIIEYLRTERIDDFLSDSTIVFCFGDFNENTINKNEFATLIKKTQPIYTPVNRSTYFGRISFLGKINDEEFTITLNICNYYKDKGVTKIVTIESSGIAPAAMVALKMNLPLIILKKKESKILDEDFIQTEVTSYTKANPYNLTLACKFINENDHCVIIDDFLANGEAATGAIRLLRKLHATIAGVGILVEKSYQPGRKKLEEAGIDVFSLARIKKLDTGIIEFVEE